MVRLLLAGKCTSLPLYIITFYTFIHIFIETHKVVKRSDAACELLCISWQRRFVLPTVYWLSIHTWWSFGMLLYVSRWEYVILIHSYDFQVQQESSDPTGHCSACISEGSFSTTKRVMGTGFRKPGEHYTICFVGSRLIANAS